MVDDVKKEKDEIEGSDESKEETVDVSNEEPVEEAQVEAEAPAKKPRKKRTKKTETAESAEKKKKPKKDTLKTKKVEKVDKVAMFNQKYLKSDIPIFKAGDTLRVHYQIVEGDKTRIQVFEGICIARKHGGLNETITVRKMSGQIGVERTFFLHSRRIEKIEVKKIGKVRRAKIYFLRSKIGKKARIREAGIH
jgi:large subunit ribosomal protein L19